MKRRLSIAARPIVAVSGGVLLVGVLTAAWLLFGQRESDGAAAAASSMKLGDIPFNGAGRTST